MGRTNKRNQSWSYKGILLVCCMFAQIFFFHLLVFYCFVYSLTCHFVKYLLELLCVCAHLLYIHVLCSVMKATRFIGNFNASFSPVHRFQLHVQTIKLLNHKKVCMLLY